MPVLVTSPASIPTLNTCGLMLMSLLLGGMAMRRQRNSPPAPEKPMNHNHRPVPALLLALLSCAGLHAPAALAADVSITLPANGDFVIKNSVGAERLRVQRTGEVLVPALPADTATGSQSVSYTHLTLPTSDLV